jgi:tRNA dimethylallyltransferase
MDRIICVVGPTASGKTQLAIELCKLLDGEVLSCDSMQIYRGMDIGTAKPTAEEMEGIPHHMIDCVDPREDFSVGRFVAAADPIVQDILARGKTCVIAGGTGLYVDSLIQGRTFAPFPQTGRREALEARADREGTESLLAYLATFDPDAAARLHPSDRKRIIRACEVYEETGRTITAHNLETQSQPPRYHACWLGLDFIDRAELYARIDLRVERMMEAGLLDEVQRLLAAGIPENATALQAIGYKELVAALHGACTVEAAVAQIQQESRRYAKRQRTWFRRNPAIYWILRTAQTDFSQILSEACYNIPFFDACKH